MPSIFRMMGLVLLLAAVPRVLADQSPLFRGSPDRRVSAEIAATPAGLTLSVAIDGHVLFRDCPLGLRFADKTELGPGLCLKEADAKVVDRTDALVWGTRSRLRDHCAEYACHFAPDRQTEISLGVRLRIYNDAVAFRYELPQSGDVRITDELTGFHLAEDARSWTLPAQKFNSSYEAVHTIGPVSRLDEKLIGLPATFEFSRGHWAAITEAHLDDYAGLYIQRVKATTHFTTRLSPGGSETASVECSGSMVTPWRVILLGRRAADLVQSDTIFALNPPSMIEDSSWIRPGKTIWDWWPKQMVSGVDFSGDMNTKTLLYYADFAADHGLEYLLIDEGWSWWANLPDENGRIRRVTDITRPVSKVDLPRVIEHCRKRGVGVWLWLTWGHCDAQMQEAFALYEQWGVAGVKIDFMCRDDQWMVNWYQKVAENAAKHKLMVNMHGAYKPTGIGRTWPNMMTREAVLGAEASKWSRDVTPQHNLVLPFTRMLAGPMDYTPGGFHNVPPEHFLVRDAGAFVMGTRCHQLAMYVVYFSPIQMVADYPDNYRGEPGFDFLQIVPTVWDETCVIDGYPGEYAVIARRKGDDWYLGAMSAGDARTLRIPLDFLPAGSWRLDAWCDGERAHEVATQVRRDSQLVDWADTLTIAVAPSGGYVARIRPATSR